MLNIPKFLLIKIISKKFNLNAFGNGIKFSYRQLEMELSKASTHLSKGDFVLELHKFAILANQEKALRILRTN